jgi:hypothetical protein
MRVCLGKRCKKLSGRQVAGKPVWSVDGALHCQSCFDLWIEDHDVDRHKILRLSEDEKDFELAGKVRRPAAVMLAAR